jgi:hypothetical protein
MWWTQPWNYFPHTIESTWMKTVFWKIIIYYFMILYWMTLVIPLHQKFACLPHFKDGIEGYHTHFKLWSSGMWHCIVMWQHTNVSENLSRSSKTLVSYHTVSQSKRPWLESSSLWKPQIWVHFVWLMVSEMIERGEGMNLPHVHIIKKFM